MGWQPETQPKGKPPVEKTKGAETTQRLIDANALRDKLQAEIDKAKPPFDDVIGSIRCGVRLARNIVEDEPTIDAEPVRHGKNVGTDYDAVDQFVCSECGIELQGWVRVERDEDDGEVSCHEYTLRYCPQCGARVDE